MILREFSDIFFGSQGIASAKGKEKLRVLTTAQMKAADEAVIAAGTPGSQLMEQGGAAVTTFIQSQFESGRALVMVGPGNNGGDGFVIARLLCRQGWDVELTSLIPLSAFQGDALAKAEQWDGSVIPLNDVAFDRLDVIVDALFGTGLVRDITGDAASLIRRANAAEAYRVAVDIPSGINGDTGQIAGIAFQADTTISFAALKPGHLLYPGRSFSGDVQVADIGIPVPDRCEEPQILKNDPGLFKDAVISKSPEDHKYDHGHGLVLGGPKWASGAARLCADAALRVGAGLVTILAQERDCDIYAAHLTSVMLKPINGYQEIAEHLAQPKATAACLGPGAGLNDDLKGAVLSALDVGKPVVLDADALSVFESDPKQLFQAINGPVVLTPHSGEFRRLFTGIKNQSKAMQAQAAAQLSGAVVVLKGADTVIASPDGRIAINANAPPHLATAGSGDVLAGLVTGLICRSVPVFEAACAAVWLHGEIGQLGGEGLVADDMKFFISKALTHLSTVALS